MKRVALIMAALAGVATALTLRGEPSAGTPEKKPAESPSGIAKLMGDAGLITTSMVTSWVVAAVVVRVHRRCGARCCGSASALRRGTASVCRAHHALFRRRRN